VNEDVRTAILGVGLTFCVLFAAASIAAVIDSGPSTRGLILGGISLVIVWMIMLGLWGAIKNPPKR
jgi:hypothetical protein